MHFRPASESTRAHWWRPVRHIRTTRGIDEQLSLLRDRLHGPSESRRVPSRIQKPPRNLARDSKPLQPTTLPLHPPTISETRTAASDTLYFRRPRLYDLHLQRSCLRD